MLLFGFSMRLPVISTVTPKSSCIWNPRWSKVAHDGLGSPSPFMTDPEAADCNLCGISELIGFGARTHENSGRPAPIRNRGPSTRREDLLFLAPWHCCRGSAMSLSLCDIFGLCLPSISHCRRPLWGPAYFIPAHSGLAGSLLLCWSVLAAMVKHHQPGAFHSMASSWSLSSGGQSLRSRHWSGWFFPRLWGRVCSWLAAGCLPAVSLHIPPLCACLCVQMSPSNKDTSRPGLGLTWVTSF